MYSDNTDEGKVIEAYESFYRDNNFIKNKHTQYYKRWLRNLSRETIPPKKVKSKCFEVKNLNLKSLIKIKVDYNQVGSDRITNAIGIMNNKNNFIIPVSYTHLRAHET